MTRHDAMYIEIEKHGENLNRIFKTKYGNIELCKKLFRLENKLHHYAEQYCNGDISENQYDIFESEIAKIVGRITGLQKDGLPIYPLFFNRDPRGYSLKLDDAYIRDNNISIYKDWGGYGILAPNFS